MSKKIFVNLAVKDLNKSIEFFTKLGFTFNPQFTDEKATCMIIAEDIFAMLLVDQFFKGFIDTEVCDTKTHTEVLVALSFDSREEVDSMYEKAIAGGAKQQREHQEMGWMLQKSFKDLDGHIWELIFMDVEAMPKK